MPGFGFSIWAKLLTASQQTRDTHFVEFNRNALVRANMEARGAYYNLAIQGGWMSRDEIRSRENLNPIPGEGGSTFMVPLNMGPASATPEAENDDATELGARDALGVILKDTLQRMAKRIVTRHERAAKKPEELKRFLEQGMIDDNRAVVLDALTPALDALQVPGNRSSLMLEFFYCMKDALTVCGDGFNRNEIISGVSEELASRWMGEIE